MNSIPRGFVALLSVLMLSSILLVTSLSAGEAVSFAQRSVMDEFSYRASLEAAHSCARLAVSRLSADPYRFDTAGTTTVTLSPDTLHPVHCSIIFAHGNSLSARTLVQGNVEDSFIELRASMQRPDSSSPFQMTFERI